MKADDVRRILRLHNIPNEADDPDQARALLKALGYDLNTAYREAEMSSPYAEFIFDSTNTGDPVQLHSHNFYEMIYCLNSCGITYLVGSERYHVQKGDLLCIRPGASHRPLYPYGMTVPYKRIVLWVNSGFMRTIYDCFPDARFRKELPYALIRANGEHGQFIGSLFEQGLCESEHRLPGWEMAMVGTVFQICTAIERALLDKNTAWLPAVESELLDRIIAYVEKHYPQKITIQEVASQFYVSSSTVSHLFREKMDVSFYNFVTQRRLVAAKTLIAQGIPLDQINEQIGFANYQTFFRAFKQAYGISPMQYRKMSQAET